MRSIDKLKHQESLGTLGERRAITYLGHVEVYRRNLEILSLLNISILAPASGIPYDVESSCNELKDRSNHISFSPN
jgi:hypothetical protein